MGFLHYKLLDAMDFGPTYLWMVAKYYGKSYSLHYLRSRSYITREGVSMLGISEAAENVGFRTKGYRLSWKGEILRELKFDILANSFTVDWENKKLYCLSEKDFQPYIYAFSLEDML